MREIKFRAYDTARKEYLSGGNVFISINPSPRPIKSDIYLDDLKYINMYRDRFILEQWTGLKDKNGTDIYEGDICKDRYGELVVKWDDECARFLGYYRRIERETKINYIDQCDKNGISVMDVIGNIHDNSKS